MCVWTVGWHTCTLHTTVAAPTPNGLLCLRTKPCSQPAETYRPRNARCSDFSTVPARASHFEYFSVKVLFCICPQRKLVSFSCPLSGLTRWSPDIIIITEQMTETVLASLSPLLPSHDPSSVEVPASSVCETRCTALSSDERLARGARW